MIKLFTIGFTGKPAEKFFSLLKNSGVKKIVDTRINNVSQLAGFAKGSDLRFFAKEIANISYEHNVDLAPTKELLAKYRNKELDWNQYEHEYLNLLDIRKIDKKIDLVASARMSDQKLFGNTGKAIHPDKIHLLHYSLMLIQVEDFAIFEKPHEYHPGKTQFRLEFLYKRNKYDFVITDPAFLENYKRNPDYLSGVSDLFLTLSVGVKWMDWYYKLVAGIILS